MSPFKGRTLTVRDTSAQGRVLEEGSGGVSPARHLWVSAGHVAWGLLPHAAQVPGSRPHLHALSGCFCYHRSVRRVHDLPRVGIPRNASEGPLKPASPGYGARKGRQDKRLQTVTVIPFLLDRSTPTVSVPHGGGLGGGGWI